MELFLAMIVNLCTQIIKKHIKPKFGDSGVQMFVFGLSFVFVAVQMLIQKNESFREMFNSFVVMIASAITMYEVLWKKLFGK